MAEAKERLRNSKSIAEFAMLVACIIAAVAIFAAGFLVGYLI